MKSKKGRNNKKNEKQDYHLSCATGWVAWKIYQPKKRDIYGEQKEKTSVCHGQDYMPSRLICRRSGLAATLPSSLA